MTFGIIGYGSFGQLLADILSDHGEVRVYKRDNEGVAQFVTFEEAADTDVVILATGLSSMDEISKKLAEIIKPDTIVADVCSVKLKPVEILTKNLSGKCRILATHPLFGPHTVEGKSVAGKNIVLCSEQIEGKDKIVAFLQDNLGLKVIEMSPEEHDREMAWIHALTFFVSHGVMKLNPPKSELTTGYYQKLLDLVELESTHSIELFNTVQKGNPYAAEIRRKLLEELTQIDSELNNE